MPAEVRSLGPIERVMYLRTLPLFGTMPAEDLGAIADWTAEREFAQGETLLEEGAPVESIHILTRGAARVSRGDQTFRVFGPRDAVGVIGLLSRDPLGVRAVALERSGTLELGRRPLVRMFEERFDVFLHLLREVSRLLVEERDLGSVEPSPIGSEWATRGVAPDAIDLVDRIQWLGAGMRFARSHPLALSKLARTAEVRSVMAGTTVRATGDAAGTIVIPMSGSMAVRDSEGVELRAGSGAALGLVEAFAELDPRKTLVATESSTLLIVQQESLLDVFEDHPRLALDCLAEMATQLLAVFMQRAQAELEVPRGLGARRRIASVPALSEPMGEVRLRG